MKWEKEDCPTDLRVNGVSEAPDHDERGSHDDVGRVVDAFIQQVLLSDRHGNNTIDRRVPINVCHSLVLAELQVRERLVFLRVNIR